MTPRKRTPQILWSVAGGLLLVGAGALGALTVTTTDIPTAREWILRETGSKIQVDFRLPSERPRTTADGLDPILVPRVFTFRMPARLRTETDVDARKALFIRTVLPLVLEVNARVAADRNRLKALRARQATGRTLSGADRRWLQRIMREYDVETLDWDMLLRRVDTVPPSLALAQAAIESAWGTSRFAQQGNALFGEWAWGDSAGIAPKKRREDQTHVVRSFPTPLQSVFSYEHNLNTHSAYKRFRALRQKVKAENPARPGYTLAATLDRYSQRREAYVKELRQIIAANKLQRFNNAVLGAPNAQVAMDEAPAP